MADKKFNSVAEAYEDAEKRRKAEVNQLSSGNDVGLSDVYGAISDEVQAPYDAVWDDKNPWGLTDDQRDKAQDVVYYIKNAGDAAHSYEDYIPNGSIKEFCQIVGKRPQELFPRSIAEMRKLASALTRM